ncbi:MAG: hypothetical protein GY702_24985 [Desulfobulbaceae bacterium]|nr:hypothetical protein [Desulfobulbaceae bacterium]
MMNDANSLDHALKKGSIGALWKLSGVGLILAITTVLIMMLIRTVS